LSKLQRLTSLQLDYLGTRSERTLLAATACVRFTYAVRHQAKPELHGPFTCAYQISSTCTCADNVRTG
jgi:hypothetical protein